MPRRRGKDEVRSKRPSSGTQFEQADDAVAKTRNRALQEPRNAKQRSSEIARKTPYGKTAARRQSG